MRKFWGITVGLLFCLVVPHLWAFPPEYEIIIEKNPFSPERKYTPAPSEKNGKGEGGISEEYKRQLILRGTFWNGKQYFAVIEVKAGLKNKLHLEKSRLLLQKGESLGDCVVEEIKRGEVVLGGSCEKLKLSLADAPERKRALPQITSRPPSSEPPSSSRPPVNKTKRARRPSSSPPNPFKKLLQQGRPQ